MTLQGRSGEAWCATYLTVTQSPRWAARKFFSTPVFIFLACYFCLCGFVANLVVLLLLVWR